MQLEMCLRLKPNIPYSPQSPWQMEKFTENDTIIMWRQSFLWATGGVDTHKTWCLSNEEE